MTWPSPTVLSGCLTTLRPLCREDQVSLTEAAIEGELQQLWYTKIPDSEQMESEIERRLHLQQQGSMLPFTVLDRQGTPVGMTTYMNIHAAYRRLEIGSTWIAKRVQRTGLNTECKYLLLRHAFESLNCIAVELRTSFHNQTSRRAIERIGAKLDGVLRNHQLHSDGTKRDTCVYSILDSEWPTTSSHLHHLMSRHSNAAEKDQQGLS